MTKVFVALGSNLGNRALFLEGALKALPKVPGLKALRSSALYETKALLPEGAHDSWNQPFLNMVLELEYSQSAETLLEELHKIEQGLHRKRDQNWAPRTLDLDILLFGDQKISSATLSIPHPRMWERAFVLDPLKDLNSQLRFDPHAMPVAQLARKHPDHLPLIMGILNLTPDSFSNQNISLSFNSFESTVRDWNEQFIPIVDLGAESTRPRATPLTHEEEWQRLEPYLRVWKNIFAGTPLKPKLSLDTRHPKTALKALSFEIDIVNDVSGLQNESFYSVLKDCSTDYVLTFSPGVPADTRFAHTNDPVKDMLHFFNQHLEKFDHHGIALSRIILDPGLGFGKTPQESIAILKNISCLEAFPCRNLVGHSRKSFIQNISTNKVSHKRDPESIGISVFLAERGVDILRVHEPLLHKQAIFSYKSLQ